MSIFDRARGLCLLLGVLLCASAFGAERDALTALDIRMFMTVHYGHHDAAHGGWVGRGDVDADGGVHFYHTICASLAPAVAGVPSVMLAVCNKSTGHFEGASVVDDPGSVDLYELQWRGGNLVPVASLSKYRGGYVGSPAYARVVRLGRDAYGFELGGPGLLMEQGCGFATLAMLAPAGATLVKVLELKDAAQRLDGAGVETAESMDVHLDSHEANADFYPLIIDETLRRTRVVKGQGAASGGKESHQRVVLPFDAVRRRYEVPKGFGWEFPGC